MLQLVVIVHVDVLNRYGYVLLYIWLTIGDLDVEFEVDIW